jgi:hypothetical protein
MVASGLQRLDRVNVYRVASPSSLLRLTVSLSTRLSVYPKFRQDWRGASGFDSRPSVSEIR